MTGSRYREGVNSGSSSVCEQSTLRLSVPLPPPMFRLPPLTNSLFHTRRSFLASPPLSHGLLGGFGRGARGTKQKLALDEQGTRAPESRRTKQILHHFRCRRPARLKRRASHEAEDHAIQSVQPPSRMLQCTPAASFSAANKPETGREEGCVKSTCTLEMCEPLQKASLTDASRAQKHFKNAKMTHMRHFRTSHSNLSCRADRASRTSRNEHPENPAAAPLASGLEGEPGRRRHSPPPSCFSAARRIQSYSMSLPWKSAPSGTPCCPRTRLVESHVSTVALRNLPLHPTRRTTTLAMD